jgi:phthiodiolone/phenolphthiodiolone dimycocerosates ketoreductase
MVEGAPALSLRIGVTGMSRLPSSRVIDDTRRAEADGASCVLWPDHLMAWHGDELWTSRYTPLAAHQKSPHEYLNVVACAAVAASAVERIRVGSGVTDVQRTHPAVLAQQYLTIHHISGGRCILGLGAGEKENTAPYGIRTSRPVAMLEDALEIIRLLWESDGPVDFDSEFWPMRRGVLGLGPVVDAGFPAIWVAGHGPKMLEITGRLADGWIPMLMAPDEYAKRLAVVENARNAAGKNGEFESAIWSYVCYGDSREDCLKIFESPMYKSLALLLPASEFEAFGVPHPLGEKGGLGGFVPTWFAERELLDVLERVPVELVAKTVLHGTVDDVVGDLEALSRAGARTAVLANVSFLSDETRVRESYVAQRFVLDRFRD